jgi:hypothetical protein
MIVVKKEDKETKVHALLQQALAALPQVEGTLAQLCYVAKSSQSPVARAVAALAPQIATAGVKVRAIFAQHEPGHPSARLLGDVRCHDAHELLVLSPATAWVGDCMRRDPSNRDSYELHASECAATASALRASFDKLWALSVPQVGVEDPDLAEVFGLAQDLAGLAGETPSLPVALTRH